MVHPPEGDYAIWHFWDATDHRLLNWYLNIQTAFRRTADGIDTQDLEVDLLAFPDGTWTMKDWELLDERVAEGRFTEATADHVRSFATELGERLDREGIWWDRSWADWTPPPEW